MNTKQINHILIFSLVIALAAIVACEGSAGPQGAQGLQGEQGSQGERGPEGTANVTSYLFTDLEWNGARAITIFYDNDFDIPEDVQEEGIVLFYVKFDASFTGWWPAPNPYVSIEGEVYSITAAYGNASIGLLLRNPDGSMISSDQDVVDVAALRIILVPPGVVIPAKMPAGFWKDYEAVAEYFGIPD